MYFFSEEERRYLLRGLIPRARRAEVAEELRGWNWHQPPLEPPYDVRLGVYEVAAGYCPTARDVYLRRVARAKPRPFGAVQAGAFFHAVLSRVVIEAKRLLYSSSDGCYREAFSRLSQGGAEVVGALWPRFTEGIRPEEAAVLRDRALALWDFEASRLAARVFDVLSRYAHLNVDALVSLAIPVVVEQKLNGSFIGLSSQLSVDAALTAEPIILDVKFGEPEEFHRLGTTGYALAWEAVYEVPINVGCIVYAEFRDGRWLLRRDFHLIDDELRQWFVEERDRKMRLVFEELDPGVAETCPQCFYNDVCGQPRPST